MAENDAPVESSTSTRLQAHTYKDLNDVPNDWRMLRGARLSLEQVNSIIETAHKLQIARGDVNIPSYGVARELFQLENEIRGSIWVPKRSLSQKDLKIVEEFAEEFAVEQEDGTKIPNWRAARTAFENEERTKKKLAKVQNKMETGSGAQTEEGGAK